MADEPTVHRPQSYAILTADLWHYEFAIKVKEIPKDNPYQGHWIDFEDGGVFEKGVYDKTTVSGTYTYNNDTKILHIIPEKGDEDPSEWEIRTNGEVLILVGTSTYGNNNEQIKLVRATSKPVK